MQIEQENLFLLSETNGQLVVKVIDDKGSTVYSADVYLFKENVLDIPTHALTGKSGMASFEIIPSPSEPIDCILVVSKKGYESSQVYITLMAMEITITIKKLTIWPTVICFGGLIVFVTLIGFFATVGARLGGGK